MAGNPLTELNSKDDQSGKPILPSGELRERNKEEKKYPLKWSLLPLALSAISVIGFVISFILAKVNCHIQRWIVPLVSYTGTEHPESMVFGLFFSIEGFLAYIVVFVVWTSSVRFLSELSCRALGKALCGFVVVFLAWRYYRCNGQQGRLNTAALVTGSLCCFGVVMVGNFQVTKGKVPHYIGATLAFLIGNIYEYLASFLSRAAFRESRPPRKHGKKVVIFRFVVATIMSLAIVCLVVSIVYKRVLKDASDHNQSKKGVDPSYPHNGSCADVLDSVPLEKQRVDLVAALSEWSMTAAILLFLSLYSYEFRAFYGVKVVLRQKLSPLGGSVEAAWTGKVEEEKDATESQKIHNVQGV